MSSLILPRLSRAFGSNRLGPEELEVSNGEVNLRDAALDGELSQRAREVGLLKLRLAELLEVLGRQQGHFELGFSSMEAYVRERCERSGRWAAQLRTVARRLAALLHCRATLARGRIHWSHAEVLARYATADTEQHLLQVALRSTVRQLRAVCKKRVEQTGAPAAAELAAAELEGEGATGGEEIEQPATEQQLPDASEWWPSHTLALTLDQEDAWLLESTRWLAQAQGVRTQQEFMDALLAEGWTTFIAWSETTGQDIDRCLVAYEKRAREHRAQQAYNAERRRWREAAEVACEPIWQARVRSVAAAAMAAATGETATPAAGDLVLDNSAPDASPAGRAPQSTVSGRSGSQAKRKRAERIDREIHRLAQALAERDLELGRLLLRFHAADGWRRLGFASFSQYAEERLGMSYSSVKARITLARRALRLPAIADAVTVRRLGFEAAMLIARVASASTVGAWIERAAERTLKHLAEEVEAAGMLQRLALTSEVKPPSELRMAELSALRGKIMAMTTGTTTSTSIGFGDMASAQQLAIEELKEWARRSLARRAGSGDSSNKGRGSALSQAESSYAEHSTAYARGSEMSGGGQPGESPGSTSDGQVSAGAQVSGSAHAEASESMGTAADGEKEFSQRELEARGRRHWRMRVEGETLSFFRAFEDEFRRHSVRGFGFVRYLCLAFWKSWWRSKRDSIAYAEIYQRDAHCCASPVCRRHDVTPHHLRFRSQGGGDEPENLLSLCVWCHLYGVHQGRLSVRPPASSPYWEIGRLRVQGRQRLAAC